MPTVPTATTMARSRATAPARFTGSLLDVSAVISTESTPAPRELARHRSRNVEAEVVDGVRTHASSKIGARGINVHSQNATTSRFQQLHRELAEQTRDR